MEDVWVIVKGFFSGSEFYSGLRAVAILLFGLVLASAIPKRLTWSAIPPRRLFFFQQMTKYAILSMAVIVCLHQLGFNLSVLLGAAGIFSVAIGFASQTSASNLISGFFLMAEQPFGVGDTIRVGDVTGEVLTIDPLSVKIRTFDNLMVRIPNETMLKSNVTNVTRFPVRRYDLPVGVAYKEDIEVVKAALLEVADKNPVCLEEPKPQIIFLGYGDSALSFQFSVWAKTEQFMELRNGISAEIKAAFDERNIEIPFPHRSLYSGEATKPFPIRLVTDDNAP